jgi:hypothetical protein
VRNNVVRSRDALCLRSHTLRPLPCQHHVAHRVTRFPNQKDGQPNSDEPSLWSRPSGHREFDPERRCSVPEEREPFTPVTRAVKLEQANAFQCAPPVVQAPHDAQHNLCPHQRRRRRAT